MTDKIVFVNCICQGIGWVCESHEDKPWNCEHKEHAPGMPCPECNTEVPPRPEPGVVILHSVEDLEEE